MSKRQYAWMMGMQFSLAFLGVLLMGFVGSVLLFITLLCLMRLLLPPYSVGKMAHWMLSFILNGSFSAVCILVSVSSRRKGLSINSIEIVTDQNAHLLPLEETLVRASDLPLTRHQTELLRATEAAQETPKEELLRASAEKE